MFSIRFLPFFEETLAASHLHRTATTVNSDREIKPSHILSHSTTSIISLLLTGSLVLHRNPCTIPPPSTHRKTSIVDPFTLHRLHDPYFLPIRFLLEKCFKLEFQSPNLNVLRNS